MPIISLRPDVEDLIELTTATANSDRDERLRGLLDEASGVELDIRRCTNVLLHSNDLRYAEQAEADLDELEIDHRDIWDHIVEAATGH